MNFQRLATGIVIAPVLAELDTQPELWGEITLRQEYPGSAHHDTECIFLRGPVIEHGAPLAAVFDTLDSADYPALDKLPQTANLLVRTLGFLAAVDVGRVMVVNLFPGGVIDPHVDEGAYAEAFERFHLSLQSEEGNSFTVAGETVHMAPGELWWFNHRREHTVRNDSDRPRLHLIIDAIRRPA
jgi:hypothetical protein